MGNTNLKGLVIDGQPQGLGNKMVTYDGLVDFLEMLKDEIPRMGYNNTIAKDAAFSYAFGSSNILGEEDAERSGYSYIFGAGNKVQQDTFNELYILGSSNRSIRAADSLDSIYNVYVLGNLNTNINNANHVYILGHSNIAQGDSYTEPLFQAYGFGNNLTLTSNAVWLGQYNDPNDSIEKIVFGIGNGNWSERKNLLTIDEDGGIRFPNATFQTLVHFSKGINVTGAITLQNSRTIMSGLGELRHVLIPYNQNECFWLIENNEDDPQKVLHINRRQPYDYNGYTSERTCIVPQEIQFHAGLGTKNWANLICGSLDAKGTLTAETIKSTMQHQGNWLLTNPQEETGNQNYRYLKKQIEPGLYWIEFFRSYGSGWGDANVQIGATMFWCAGDPSMSYTQKVALEIEGWDLIMTYSIEENTPYLTIEYDTAGAGGGSGTSLSNVVKFIRIMEGV